MKIFAAGIATETNTFCPIPTALEDFCVQRGMDASAGSVEYPSLDLCQTWGKYARSRGDTFVFSLMAFAQPSGITLRVAYESLRDELLADLCSASPVDVVLLMLHGAMIAEGYDDCEEDIIRRVRSIVGPTTIIGVELDLHCHLSESMIRPADIVVTYKEYPHIDINERAKELFDLAIRAKLGEIRPRMALFDCQMIGLYPTTRQPLRGFVDDMLGAERRGEVLSLSFGHGFQFGDVPHIGAKVLAISDDDPPMAKRLAREFGLRAYELRGEIGFESLSLPMDKALSRALSSDKTPVVVADQSDNAGIGAPGDATFALQWLLDHDADSVAMAAFYDPEVVRMARKAGNGATLLVRIGGKMGPLSGDPVELKVTVFSSLEDYMYAFPLQSGEIELNPTGTVVALRSKGIDIVVASERCQCFSPTIFNDLGIDPTRKRLLIPKSAQHFHAAFAPIAHEVMYMAGPGATPPDPRLISYRRASTDRLYPWIQDPLGQ